MICQYRIFNPDKNELQNPSGTLLVQTRAVGHGVRGARKQTSKAVNLQGDFPRPVHLSMETESLQP